MEDLLNISPSTIGSLKKGVEKQSSGEKIRKSSRKLKLTSWDDRVLERLVKRIRRDSLGDITNNVNENRDRSIAKHILKCHLHEHGFARRVPKKSF